MPQTREEKMNHKMPKFVFFQVRGKEELSWNKRCHNFRVLLQQISSYRVSQEGGMRL